MLMSGAGPVRSAVRAPNALRVALFVSAACLVAPLARAIEPTPVISPAQAEQIGEMLGIGTKDLPEQCHIVGVSIRVGSSGPLPLVMGDVEVQASHARGIPGPTRWCDRGGAVTAASILDDARRGSYAPAAAPGGSTLRTKVCGVLALRASRVLPSSRPR